MASPSSHTVRAVRGGAVMTLGKGLRIVTQLVGLVVLARFLSPTDYGLVTMSAVVVGIAGVLGDFGVSLSAMRSRTLSTAERDTLFWFSTALGCALAVTSIAISPLIERFYHSPGVWVLVSALSPVFVLNGAQAQYRVDAARRGKYVLMAASDASAAVLALAAGVAAAVLGLHYWALILQGFVSALVTLMALVAGCRWLPGPPSVEGRLRAHLGFGTTSMATAALNYVSSNVDSAALGRFLGPAAVGTYSRAFQLYSFPVDQLATPLTDVLLPLLSRVERDDLPRVLARVQNALAYPLLATACLIAVGGSPLTTVVLGPRWAESGFVAQFLLAGALFQVSAYVYYWAFLATGRNMLLLWCEMPPRLVMIVLIVVGATFGPAGAATGFTLGLGCNWLVITVFGIPRLGWRRSELVRSAVRPAVLFACSYGVAAVVRGVAASKGLAPVPVLLISYGVAAACVGAFLLAPSYRREVSGLIELARSLRTSASPLAPPATTS